MKFSSSAAEPRGGTGARGHGEHRRQGDAALKGGSIGKPDDWLGAYDRR